MSNIPKRRADNSEIIPYNYDDYYVFIGVEKLSDHPNKTMFDHWHDDIEIMMPLHGHMMFDINGKTIRLEEGSGVLINSKQIHCAYSSDGTDCDLLYLLWHPVVLCSTGGITRKYVNPILQNESLAYIHLTTDVPWKQAILSFARQMLEHMDEPNAPLLFQSVLHQIWRVVYENCYDASQPKTSLNSQLSALRDMLVYLGLNYMNKIYLEDIANAGKVSISTCNVIFKKYLHEAPIKYLLNYRLMKSCELLSDTEQSITDIAYDVGFANLSYYIDAFHKKYGFTPAEYRRNTHMEQG